MYNHQPFISPTANDGAVRILWIGIACYVIGFMTPQITTDYELNFEEFYAWDILSDFGLLLIITSIVLTYISITKAKVFAGIKKFGITGAFLTFIATAAISSELDDLNTLTTILYGENLFNYGLGFYLLWGGIIASVVGSLKATSQPAGYQQQHGTPQQSHGQQYQSPVQQQNSTTDYYNQQPPVQQPTYIDPQPTNYPITEPQHTPIKAKSSNFCSTCGVENKIGDQFCANCGTRFV